MGVVMLMFVGCGFFVFGVVVWLCWDDCGECDFFCGFCCVCVGVGFVIVLVVCWLIWFYLGS